MINMSKFKKHGYLTINYRHNLRKIKDENKTLSELLVNLIETGWELQFKLEVDLNNLNQVHSVTLYSRIINYIQSSHLLAVYGLGVQSSNECRAALECLFQLAALNNEKDLLSRLLKSDMGKSLEYKKKQKQYRSSNKLVSDVRLEKDEQEINELEKRIKFLDGIGIKQLGKVKAIAEVANMLYWYDLMYSRLSMDTHSSLESLQEHMHFIDNRLLSHITNEPNFKNFSSNSYCCLKILCRAIQEVYKAFGEEKSDILDDYVEKLENIRFDEFMFEDQ